MACDVVRMALTYTDLGSLNLTTIATQKNKNGVLLVECTGLAIIAATTDNLMVCCLVK